jgi:hypothetical protein
MARQHFRHSPRWSPCSRLPLNNDSQKRGCLFSRFVSFPLSGEEVNPARRRASGAIAILPTRCSTLHARRTS